VIGEPLVITSSTTLPPAGANSRDEFPFTATGGTRPYRWRVGAASVLPAGLTLAADGVLSGIPAAEGTFRFVVEVQDAGNLSDSRTVTLVVENRDLDILSTSPLPPATAGLPYSHQLRANAPAATELAWSVIEGSLPAGLNLNSRTGEISGIADEPVGQTALFNFRLQVAATGRNPFRKVFDLTVLPAPAGFRIVTPSPLTDGILDRPYRAQISAAGGAPPYTFASASRLPNGVRFTAEGALTGTPTETGIFNIAITALDRNQSSATQTYEWRVIPASAGPIITSGPLLSLNGVGQPLNQLLEAVEGARPFLWSITSGTLPPGVTFDPVTGRLSGQSQQTGLFRFTVQVTDANRHTDIRTLELPVTATGEVLQLVTQTLPGATVGRVYATNLEARGGLPPYQFSVRAGTLPNGLRIAGNQIVGTTTEAVAANITLRLADAVGFEVIREFALRSTLDALPAVQLTGLPDRINPGQQFSTGVELTAAYAADLTGRLEMIFAPEPAVAGVDPALQFSSGGRAADFRIPAGQTRAVFSVPSLAIQTGTVAGTINFRLTLALAGQPVTPPNAVDRSVRINQLAPVISGVELERRANGFNIHITGFSTTRELSEATVTLTPAAGRELQTTRYVVAVTETFRGWFNNAQSLPFGTQFRLTLPFDGDPAVVQSVRVRLRNSVGESEER
jgi:hypothetical protein